MRITPVVHVDGATDAPYICCGARVLSSQNARLSTKEDWGLNPPAPSFTPYCLCLLEQTQKAIGLFYLVSMPGVVKVPTRGKCVTCCGLYLSTTQVMTEASKGQLS